jgi:gamma-carbonic anhydrase
MKINVID